MQSVQNCVQNSGTQRSLQLTESHWPGGVLGLGLLADQDVEAALATAAEAGSLSAAGSGADASGSRLRPRPSTPPGSFDDAAAGGSFDDAGLYVDFPS